MVLIFRQGSRVDPAKWPCPRVAEGTAGCRKRFWSDGEARRSRRLPDKERKYEIDRQTFACRFYDRMVSASPCEGALPLFSIRLFDSTAVVMPNTPFRLSIGSDIREGKADSQGFIHERSVKVPGRAILEWGADPAPFKPNIFRYRIELELDFEGEQQQDPDRLRLHNLGYGQDCTFEDGLEHFQRDYGVAVTRELDDASRKELDKAHDKATPRRKPDSTPAPPAPQPQEERDAAAE